MDVKALHKIGYGVYLVGSGKEDRLNAQVVNTVFQVTSQPPTLAVSINKNNLTWELVEDSRAFTVSVLCQDTPLSFIGRFGFRSGRELDKLQGVSYKIGQTGAPIILDNAVAYMEARVTQEMDVDTHTIFVGELVDSEVLAEKACMTYEYYHGVKRGVTPRAAASYVDVQEKVQEKMAKYRCTVCGYVYDPEKGDPEGDIKPGTAFEDLPDDWTCPICGAQKSEFERLD